MFKDESFRFVVPPCFTRASRRGPYGVQPYSSAMTGAPVAAYTRGSRCAAPRPCSPKPSVPVSTNPGSLCRISMATLLFLAFEGHYSVPIWVAISICHITGSVKPLFCTKERGPTARRRSPLCFAYWKPAFSVRLDFRFFFRSTARMRLSSRTEARVPMDWKICTRITSTTTETHRMMVIRR